MKDIFSDVYAELFPYILRILAVPIIVASLLYGLVTQDSHKAGELYMSMVRTLSAPFIYSISAPLRNVVEDMQKKNALQK